MAWLARRPRVGEDLLERVPGLADYLKVINVCHEYDLSHPRCREADYEWECPCVASRRELEGRIPKDVFLSIAHKLEPEEVKALVREGYVEGLYTGLDHKVACEAGGYAVVDHTLYDDFEEHYRVYKVYDFGGVKVYEPVGSAPVDALVKCIELAPSFRRFSLAVGLTLQGLLPRDVAKKFLDLDKLAPYTIRRLAESGVITREDAVEALKRIAARRKGEVVSEEEARRMQEEAEEKRRKIEAMIAEARRIMKTLRESLKGLPVAIEAKPDPFKVKLEEKETHVCVDGEWVVDKDKLNLEWVCHKETTIKAPVAPRSIDIFVYSLGYMEPQDFKRYLSTLKKLGFYFNRKSKMWGLTIAGGGVKRRPIWTWPM